VIAALLAQLHARQYVALRYIKTPRLKTLHRGDAGEILFVPLGWWHQVKALDFSMTITYTNFVWPNDSCRNIRPMLDDTSTSTLPGASIICS
jgi:hypothetical protein